MILILQSLRCNKFVLPRNVICNCKQWHSISLRPKYQHTFLKNKETLSTTKRFPSNNLRLRSSSTSTTTNATKTKSSSYNQLKALVSEYGIYATGTYATIYVATFSISFLGISSGLIDPGSFISDIESTVEGYIIQCCETWDINQDWIQILHDSSHIVNLGLSWIVTSVLGPARLVAAVFLTPRVARILGATRFGKRMK